MPPSADAAAPPCFIAHRRNTLQRLTDTPPTCGVEMDVRETPGGLEVTHDPFTRGVPLQAWLDAYEHALLVVNIKAEGLAALVAPLLHARGIHDYFFLDQSMPFVVRTLRGGESRVAVRLSHHEPFAGAMSFSGRAQWVWVDVFDGLPIDQAQAAALVQAGFKLCVVSPALHGHPPARVQQVQRTVAAWRSAGVPVAAVCDALGTAGWGV